MSKVGEVSQVAPTHPARTVRTNTTAIAVQAPMVDTIIDAGVTQATW